MERTDIKTKEDAVEYLLEVYDEEKKDMPESLFDESMAGIAEEILALKLTSNKDPQPSFIKVGLLMAAAFPDEEMKRTVYAATVWGVVEANICEWEDENFNDFLDN